MARARSGFVCHNHTSWTSFHVHHVWPSGYHGPDEAWNRVQLCPNAHNDVHHLLERMLKGRPNDLSTYGPVVRMLAAKGYAAVLSYGEELSNV